uniref:Endoplasmic reticulum junction formation protein lunapark n=1 Tax=Knipowitschia caucasica TaxID=637954 RepID=A0AAV2JJ92_KNICA
MTVTSRRSISFTLHIHKAQWSARNKWFREAKVQVQCSLLDVRWQHPLLICDPSLIANQNKSRRIQLVHKDLVNHSTEMGAFTSRSKKNLTRTEQLENMDKEIKELMDFQAKNQRLQRLWVGRLLVYSSVLYLLTSLLVYCVFLPERWIQRFTMAMPFFAYPVVVWFIRKLFIYLFSKRTESNNDKLEELKLSKKKMLEEVMETETYKKAKQILEQFDPDAVKKQPQLSPRPSPGTELRLRGVPMGSAVTAGGPPERLALSSPLIQGPLPGPIFTARAGGLHPPGPPLSRPILPQERGAFDRVVEYLVGDGPQNRYALICKQCFSHNGMALKEEFEFLAYRCAYCYFLNPARKTRPQAPRLPEFSYERRLRAEGSPSRGNTPSIADEDEMEEGTVSANEMSDSETEVKLVEESGTSSLTQTEPSLEPSGPETVE